MNGNSKSVENDNMLSAQYTVQVKKKHTKLLPITSPDVNRLKIFFTVRLSGKFATNLCLNIPPHFHRVATLPFGTYVQKIAILKK